MTTRLSLMFDSRERAMVRALVEQAVTARLLSRSEAEVRDGIDRATDALMALRPDVSATEQILRKALEMYADPDTYHLEILGRCALGDDRDIAGEFGVTAREALRGSSPQEPGKPQ